MSYTDGKCDDCGGKAHDLLTTPLIALCFNCWDGEETPQDSIERIKETKKD